MTRYVAIFAVAWMLVGCRAPAPSFDLLAPYGSPRVPPPRTGAVGTGGAYYAPTTPNPPSPTTTPISPATVPVFPPAVPSSSQPAAPPVSYMGGASETVSDTATSVAQASYEPGSTRDGDTPATTVTDETPPSKSTASVAGSASALQLNGMRVNDATQSSEPAQFSPASEPVNIANLPSANGKSPSFLRFISPKSGTGGSTGTPTPATPPPSGAWQSR